jgi:hypothetical protein
MDVFLENATRIFETASLSEGADSSDFALLVRPDGALHFVMETPFTLDAAAIHAGAQTAYRVTRSKDTIRVDGQSGGRNCVLEQRHPENRARDLLRDQPLYRVSSPLLTSCNSLPASEPASDATAIRRT